MTLALLIAGAVVLLLLILWLVAWTLGWSAELGRARWRAATIEAGERTSDFVSELGDWIRLSR